jgi:hypothetical protein
MPCAVGVALAHPVQPAMLGARQGEACFTLLAPEHHEKTMPARALETDEARTAGARLWSSQGHDGRKRDYGGAKAALATHPGIAPKRLPLVRRRTRGKASLRVHLRIRILGGWICRWVN